MTNRTAYIPLLILLVLAVLRCLRVYSRTGLNGEIIKAAGLSIVVASFSIDGVMLPISGLIIFNIGYIIAVTFENSFRKEYFRHLTLIEKLLGDVPKIKYDKKIITREKFNKKIGVITGIISILLGIFYYHGLTKYEITDILLPGMLFFGGMFFIIFSVFQKQK